ncbi:transposase [Psychrobacter urativorans]|uniref:helix-turn-helix domain-containing protein n=1 Tax=Psychrobacter urativorans TaxID=45610 RepID=UPI00191A1DD3
MNYTHLSLWERYQIYALIGAKHSINFIARELNRSPSTISRELRRNKSLRGYRVNYAHNEACDRRANNATTIVADIWAWVTDKLKENLRPEQIAGFHGGISHMM